MHSATRCTVSPMVPEGLCDDFFTALGFHQSNGAQYEMEMML